MKNNTNTIIQADNGNIVGRVIRAFIGTLIAGIVGGMLLAGIIIWQEGWFSLRNLAIMGLLLGFFIGSTTALLAGEKSKVIGIIAIVGCAIAVIAGRYTMLFWFSREAVTSVFDPDLINYFVTTPDLWGIEDGAWFIASGITAWYTSSQGNNSVQATQAIPQE